MLVRSLFKPRTANVILNEITFVDRVFGGFIDGKIVDSAIIGVLCYVGCLIFRFPNALLVSAIVGITNVIPFFGPFIGAVPSYITFLSFIKSHNLLSNAMMFLRIFPLSSVYLFA